MKAIKARKTKTYDKQKIKAIFIDSGRVLNGPVTGHWFITPNFFNYVDKKVFESMLQCNIKNAFNSAGNYITKQNLILTEEEEYGHFLEYYKIFNSELSELNMDEDKIEVVTRDLVYNYDKYKFYNDALEIIPELSKIYKLALVSDAWPSLEELNVSAEEVIFIDDSIKNCDGANKLGIKSFLLCRDLKSFMYNKLTCKNHVVIRSLNDVIKYIF